MDLAAFPILSPAVILSAFLAGAAALLLLRPFFRWYFGLRAMEDALGRLEGRVKRLQEMFEEEEGPALPRPGEPERGPGLPGPAGDGGRREAETRPPRRRA
ncbi:MAG: hypothetical protein AABZ64_17865 [Nitrospinota bacterium]